MDLRKKIWLDIKKIREQNPIVHNITNYVVMNNTANALLALGASPVMAHAEEEVEEMVNLASSLVINIGTLDKRSINSMYKALAAAKVAKTPVVLDPVGAGATTLRTRTAGEILKKYQPDIVRGNGSEIIALAGYESSTRGVDSHISSDDAITAGELIAENFAATVAITGKTDHIITRNRKIEIYNGIEMMGQVTGMGCTATALIGAFLAVSDSAATAAIGGITTLGLAGEIAAQKAEGPGSLQMGILDSIYNLDKNSIIETAQVEEK